MRSWKKALAYTLWMRSRKKVLEHTPCWTPLRSPPVSIRSWKKILGYTLIIFLSVFLTADRAYTGMGGYRYPVSPEAASSRAATGSLPAIPNEVLPQEGGHWLCYERPLYLTHPYLKGPDVIEVQERLNELGFSTGGVDGIYGPLTARAVENFQKSRGIKADGIVGLVTLAEMSGWQEEEAAGRTLPPRGKISILIDLDAKRLYVYSDGQIYKVYKVAVGTSDTPTPIGNWAIRRKATDWGGGFGTRWIELNVPWGYFGIHGTNKSWTIGSRASHGCIRMYNRDVEELYEWVTPGVPVKIVGTPSRREVFMGDRGSEILEVQAALQELGYYQGRLDGIFGPKLLAAVIRFQKEHGLEPDGVVGLKMYDALGLLPPGYR